MAEIQIVVTVPDKILDSREIMEEIRHVMETKTRRDIKNLFEKTTEGWSNQMNPKSGFGEVVFQSRDHFGSSEMSVTVYTRSQKYILVNAGARSHTIAPRRAKMLRFQTGYRSATSPRRIGSMSPARFGRFISARMVNHPGFEARDFDEAIAEHYAPVFERDIQDAINKSA